MLELNLYWNKKFYHVKSMFCNENCDFNLKTPNFHYEICAMLQEKNIVIEDISNSSCNTILRNFVTFRLLVNNK